MINKRVQTFTAVMAAAALSMTGCAAAGNGGQGTNAGLDPENPVNITIWNYYSGDTLDRFNKLVEEFNQGVGAEEGIVVTSLSQGSLDDLESAVMAAVEKKVGSDEVPNMFPAYADDAYRMDQMGLVRDISSYFSEEEKAKFIDGYIQEGTLGYDEGSIRIMPIAKSTEIFVLNETDWKKFADATGADKADLATLEGLTRTAQKYYEWTDSLTDAPDDGKAFYGRDSMANYMLIGARQLGVEIIERGENGRPVIHFDEDVIRKLWDNYYVPYVRGYFSAIGRFRSDDLKTGNVISYVGSSSSANFTPETVTLEDNSTYEIETGVYAAPEFQDGEAAAVQQGAGMVVAGGTDEQIAASVAFLKWFTEPAQNIEFAVGTGYLPVTKEANSYDRMKEAGSDQKEIVTQMLQVAVDTVDQNTMYTAPPVENSRAIRDILASAMQDQAAADRAQVEQMMAEGSSMEEAVQSFVTDDNFHAWYLETKEKLEAYQ